MRVLLCVMLSGDVLASDEVYWQYSTDLIFTVINDSEVCDLAILTTNCPWLVLSLCQAILSALVVRC